MRFNSLLVCYLRDCFFSFTSLIVLLGCLSVLWGIISNFVYTYSFASVISRASSVFLFSEKGHTTGGKRFLLSASLASCIKIKNV